MTLMTLSELKRLTIDLALYVLLVIELVKLIVAAITG